MKMLNRIKSVRPLEDYLVKLVFQDGYVGELDLRPLVESARGPLEEALRNVSLFRQVQCDGHSIAWPNGYDLCPDVLRDWCAAGSVGELAETAQSAESLAMHDKPAQG